MNLMGSAYKYAETSKKHISFHTTVFTISCYNKAKYLYKVHSYLICNLVIYLFNQIQVFYYISAMQPLGAQASHTSLSSTNEIRTTA